MMKRIFCALLCALMVLACVSCGDTAKTADTPEGAVPTVLNPDEYILYQNIFFNDQAGSFVNKTVTKTGTFTTLYDRYNETERYYVWGYNDQTKCCDWQWEIVPAKDAQIPANGTLVEVTGKFCASADALDGYWITDASVTTKTPYEDQKIDVDMCTMGGTLERVEIVNLQNKPEFFEGKTVRAYGRVYSNTSIQHPYYDETFELAFEGASKLPAIGTEVIVSGTFEGGVIKNATVELTDWY